MSNICKEQNIDNFITFCEIKLLIHMVTLKISADVSSLFYNKYSHIFNEKANTQINFLKFCYF